MNWRVSLPRGGADAEEQQEAWTEVERLQAIIRRGDSQTRWLEQSTRPKQQAAAKGVSDGSY